VTRAGSSALLRVDLQGDAHLGISPWAALSSLGSAVSGRSLPGNLRVEPQRQHVDDRELLKTAKAQPISALVRSAVMSCVATAEVILTSLRPWHSRNYLG
jgi:hypothetical protein